MSKFGKFFFTVVIIVFAYFAAQNWGGGGRDEGKEAGTNENSGESASDVRGGEASSVKGSEVASSEALKAFSFVPALDELPALPPPAPFEPKDNTVRIELSEYAGYAGLLLANGGLLPSEESFFFKNYGFKVHIVLIEEDNWEGLQRGDVAAASTTVDVLACYGRKLDVVVPAQIAYSRGADGVIVRNNIKRINDLKGKVLACAAFNETEFFIRYLAQEANLGVHRMDDIDGVPDPDKINLVFCEDAMLAGDAFQADVTAGGSRLAGCVTWAPKTTELVRDNEGKVRQLIDNRNLLMIADILMFNKGFARAHPDKVKGVVHGLLHGNEMVRSNPAAHSAALAAILKDYKWTEADVLEELGKVHLSNLPESLAFFSGAMDAAGSFDSIFQSANLAYGSRIIRSPVSSDTFVDLSALNALKEGGLFASQKISIEPIRSNSRSPIENDPLLSKDIRFLFLPNSTALDMAQAENMEYMKKIQQMLQVSPGSIILLRGHVDDAMVPEFRKQGGDALVRNMALKAMALSQDRADEVRKHLLERFQIAPERIERVARGWEEPLGKDPEQNRRVEVQWFTVE